MINNLVSDDSVYAPLVQLALKVASGAHEGQLRPSSTGTEEYIHHPVRVAETVARWVPHDGEAIAVALLHDTVEDSPLRVVELLSEGEVLIQGGVKKVALRALASSFGEQVAESVNQLTLPPGRRGKDQASRLEKYVRNVRSISDSKAVLVKCADMADNASSLRHSKVSLEARKWLGLKYSVGLEVLAQKASRLGFDEVARELMVVHREL